MNKHTWISVGLIAGFLVGVATGTIQLNGSATDTGLATSPATLSMNQQMCEVTLADGATLSADTPTSFTNWEESICDTGFTTSGSNIIVATEGRYEVFINVSFDTANTSANHCHLYTNIVGGTAALMLDAAGNEIGWERDIGTGGGSTDGNATGSRVVTFSADNTLVSWRLDPAAAENYTFSHGNFKITRL